MRVDHTVHFFEFPCFNIPPVPGLLELLLSSVGTDEGWEVGWDEKDEGWEVGWDEKDDFFLTDRSSGISCTGPMTGKLPIFFKQKSFYYYFTYIFLQYIANFGQRNELKNNEINENI